MGKLEAMLVNEQELSDYYILQWTPKSEGVYFCKVNVNGVEKVKKFVIVKSEK
jgi:hypothetical protein